MELIKTAIKVGNSAGVILPRKYLNSQVKILLEPLNIEKDVLNILMKEDILNEVEGIYLIGSYARGEQTIESDIDILVITSNLDKRIIKEKYEIICISKKEIELQFKDNALPILPMIKEAKIIMNKELIKNYTNKKLNKINLKWHLDTTKSALDVIKKDLEISKKLNEKNTNDRIVYSLILRLRTFYIINCIINNKKYTKKGFLKHIKEIGGSLKSYERYLRSKNNKPARAELPIQESERIINYISKELIKLKKI